MNKVVFKFVLYYKSNALLSLLQNIIFSELLPEVSWDKTGGTMAFLPSNNSFTQTRLNNLLLLG